MAMGDCYGKKHTAAHPGFQAVQNRIASKYGRKAAGAILAHATRGASATAKEKNPRLNRVK